MSDDRSSHDPEHDDPTAARLRAALNAEAAMVHPDDQLSSIRERTEGAARPWWQRPAVAAVAAAVVLGLAVGGGLALLGGDEPPVVAGGKGSTSASATESSTPSETPGTSEGSATPTSASEQEVWVYYVMDAGAAGPRLYREQHTVEAADSSLGDDAVAAMLDVPPDDSDYASAWPAETFLNTIAISGDTATVDLSRFVQAGAQLETLAVQQLVYTMTANDKSVKKVRLLVNGKTPSSGHRDWSDPVARAPRVEVQGLIWLLTPGEGATVSTPVQITGYGTAFEATINWEVRRAGSDDVVAEGFTTGGANGEFADFRDSVDLEPGTYEMRALEFSAEDGRPLNVDTKTFTVE